MASACIASQGSRARSSRCCCSTLAGRLVRAARRRALGRRAAGVGAQGAGRLRLAAEEGAASATDREGRARLPARARRRRPLRPPRVRAPRRRGRAAAADGDPRRASRLLSRGAAPLARPAARRSRRALRPRGGGSPLRPAPGRARSAHRRRPGPRRRRTPGRGGRGADRAEEPLRESLRALQMRVLYRAGRQADALAAYQDARRTLVEELGIEPSPDAPAAGARNPAAGPGARPPGGAPARAQPAARKRRRSSGGSESSSASRSLLRDSPARLLTLTGSGGSGKTRLALRAAREVARALRGRRRPRRARATRRGGSRRPRARGRARRAGERRAAARRQPRDEPRGEAHAARARQLRARRRGVARRRAAALVVPAAARPRHQQGATARAGRAGARRAAARAPAARGRSGGAARVRRDPPLRRAGARDSLRLRGARGERGRRSRPSARGSTVSRSRSSSPPRGRGSCPPRRSSPCSRAGSTPSTPPIASVRAGSARCATRSPGATTCSASASGRSSVGWRSSAAAARWPRAEAVCGGDDVFAALTTLVEHGLVTTRWATEGESRFDMLETIAEFARERLLESGELDELGRRHAEYLATFAEEVEPLLLDDGRTPWLRRLDDERDNIRAALGRAVEQDEAGPALRILGSLWLWYWRSFAEGLEWGARVLPLPSAAGGFARAGRAHCSRPRSAPPGWATPRRFSASAARASRSPARSATTSGSRSGSRCCRAATRRTWSAASSSATSRSRSPSGRATRGSSRG